MFALLAVKHSPFFLYRCNIIIMKSKKLYTKLLLASGLLLFSASLTSCNDFLTLLPTDQLPEENFWQDKADLDGVRAGAYDQLANATQTGKILQWGELRSDNLTLNTVSNTSIDNLQNAILQPNNNMFDWAGFYTGINYCNLVIEKGADMTVPGKEVDPSFTRAEYNSYRAEMFALRSLYYFYLVRSYRDVPYVTSSVRTDAEAMKSRIAVSSGVAILGECIDSVETNLKYATENFGSDAENRGRFTKNGMRALLADMYLWRACMLKDYVSKDGAGRVNLSDVAATDADGNVTGSYTTKDGEAITDAYCNTLAKTCLEKAKKYLEEKGYADHVIELEESSATVQLAAEALGVEQGMIAKTMSFLVDGEPILILTEGTAKVDNRKYKDQFHVKAKMIPFDEVEEYIGHAPGGVCPFGIKDGIKVYLDESLKCFEMVYPAAGNDHSAVRLTIAELEDVAGACGWIDVCKEM